MSADQTSLALPIKAHGKTATCAGLCTILGGLDLWEIEAMIDDGRLSWAINVASAGVDRREIRIPMCCVHDFQAGSKRDYTAAQMSLFLFGADEFIRARRFYRALNIQHNHFYALIQDRSLRLAHGSAQRRGPGGSPFLTRLDTINFLTARRIL
jgi:hypothetical protein